MAKINRSKNSKDTLLFESEELFKSIFEFSSAAIAIIEVDANISMVNDAFCKMSGYSKEELIGTNWVQKIPVEERNRLIEYNRLRLGNPADAPEKYEFVFYKKNGEFRHGLMSVSVIESCKKTITSFTDITDRKLAEEAQRMSEERFRSFVECANDIVYNITVDGILTYTSPNWTEQLGHDLTEVIGNSFRIFIHSEDIDRLSSVIKRNFQTGEKLSGVEYRIRHKNGQWRWYTSSSSPILNSKGQVLSLIGIAHDITEQKIFEEALQEREAFLNTLVQTIPDLIWLKDVDGVYLSCNTMFERYFGAKESDIIGKTDYDFVNSELADFFREHDRIAIANGKPTSNEQWVTFVDDGQRHLIEPIKTPMYNSNGKLIGVLGVARDMTERKLAEEAIKDSQTKLSLALKIAHLGSWEYDVANDLFTFNDLFYSIFRTNASQVGGFTMSSADYAKRFVHSEELAIVGKEINKSIETAEPDYVRQFEHRILYFDGEVGYITVRFAIVKDDKGKTIKLFGINQDITERIHTEIELKQSESQLREINATKDKFFSIIAHDLRGPFSVFLGFTEIMSLDIQNLTIEEIQNYSETMRDSATNLYRLLENLLQWSKMQQGTIPFNPEVWPLLQLIDESISMEPARSKGISITYDIPDTIEICADNNMLQTVIRNLVSNAVKFTPKCGKISVSAKVLTDKSVEISVKDSGIGISQEMLGNLFKLDVQTNRLGTNGEPSSGLGLLLCKEFIEKHGGTIYVESVVGKGSEFKIILPFEIQLHKQD